MPRLGRVAIFDRTWYGRVLVERVEGFCSQADWLRAYAEINDFEHDLWRAGGIVVKFWLQISDEEQLRRFDERAKVEHKRFKITEEDWRNREKAGAYHEAVCDMIDRTSSGTAPWTIVEANDKLFARVKVLRILCERLEKELKVDPLKLPPSVVAKDGRVESTNGAKADAGKETKATKGEEHGDHEAEKAREAPLDAGKDAKAEKGKESKSDKAKHGKADKGK
jgi:hypothetical protein